MVQDLIILGAGGTSREIADVVVSINAVERRWNLLGFLDDDPGKQGDVVSGFGVLGPIASACDYVSCQFLVGVTSYRDRGARRRIVELLGLGLSRFGTIIHPSASISRHARIGAGTAILHNVVITPDTTIGNHVILSQCACLSHDDVVEDYVTVAPSAVVAGLVHIRSGAYIGAGSRIIQQVQVGEHALVGIGAVVIRDVPSNTTVTGNPARPIPRFRHKQEE